MSDFCMKIGILSFRAKWYRDGGEIYIGPYINHHLAFLGFCSHG